MQIAINPLQWVATDDGWLDMSLRPPLETVLSTIRSSGFRSVMTDQPAGMTTKGYRELLTAHDLTAAPGYLGGPLEDPEERTVLCERAAAMAQLHQELGLTEMFVASRMTPDSPRVARPAVGENSDHGRLAEIAQTLAAIGETTLRYGVTCCLHQHVGSWIETSAELEWLLETLPPEVIALGPDTGHLAWADIDPDAFIQQHRSRIRALHVKDIRLDVARSTRGTTATYREVVCKGLWAEPGRGDLDLASMFAMLADSDCRWAVVEVDKPALSSPEESVAACGAWATSILAEDS